MAAAKFELKDLEAHMESEHTKKLLATLGKIASGTR